MSSLLDFQRDFVAGIFDQPRVTSLPSRRAALFGVYRNNVYSNLCEALRAVYPVAERLVGPEFFEHAARGFIRGHDSTSGDIQDYGAGFGDFLAGFPGAESLGYLGDTAQLEWLMHEAFHAPAHAPLQPARLAEVAARDCDDLIFAPHPACRLLASTYPIHRIWQANQPERDGVVDLNDVEQSGVRLLICRRGLEVQLEPLGEGEFALLSLLAAGKSFALACDVLQGEPAFDVAAFLVRCVVNGTLVEFGVESFTGGHPVKSES